MKLEELILLLNAKNRRWPLWLAAIVFAVLIWWLCKGYSGRRQVNEKLSEIQTTAKANERRVEIIFDRKEKEEAMANEKITEKLRTVSDDDLPDLLAGLLSDWRRDHPGR
ncbi:MAG: hypothetical protein IJ337_06810 [Clostridia bacterium]|nr:hypothetical protein [Clostridia bacterium]